MAEQLSALPPTNPARRSLAENGAISGSRECRGAAVRFANRFAPEHLSIPGGEAALARAAGRRGQRVSSAPGARSRSATTPAAPTTCCPPAAARARGAGFPPGISCAARPCSSFSRRDCAAWPRGLGAGRCRRAGGAPARRRGAPVNAAARRSGRAKAQGARAAFALASLPWRASGAYVAPEEGRAGQAAARFQRKHRGLFARGVARSAQNDARAVGASIRSTKIGAAAGAALWRAAGGDAADQRRGRRAALADGNVRRAGQIPCSCPSRHFRCIASFREMAGARVESVRYDEAMHFPLEATLRALARSPRILFIANPNNPTGTLLDRGGAGAHSGCRAAHAGSGGRSVLRVCRSDGAALDSPARRIWWCRARSPRRRAWRRCAWARSSRAADVAEAMRRAFTPYPVNSLALVAAEAALSDRKFLRGYVDEVLREPRSAGARPGAVGRARFPQRREFRAGGFRAGRQPVWCSAWRAAEFCCATARPNSAATVSCASPRARWRKRSGCCKRH